MSWLFLILALVAALPLHAEEARFHDVSAAEAEVYAAFLDQEFKAPKNDGPLARSSLILENEAQDYYQRNRRSWEAYLTKRVSGPGRASEECQSAFLSRPTQTLRFFSFPATHHQVRLLRSDLLRQALAKGWDAFYDAYPQAQGILSLGAIGFGSQGQEALFTARSQCGAHCGYRDLVYMRLVQGRWLIILKDSLP
jgi:hypothetical protein